MTRVLGAVIALLLAAGVAAALVDGGQRATSAPSTTSLPAVTEVLAEGQSVVTGTLEAATGDAQSAPTIPAPFTIELPAAGIGGVRIREALVGSRPATIEWSGGRPLRVEGTGVLDLGAPSRFEIRPGSLTWLLDEGPRVFGPGRYTIVSPVAVGLGGVPVARDTVDFAASSATILLSRGGAFLRQPPSVLSLEGPGSLVLQGDLTLRTESGSRPVEQLRFGPGPYLMRLQPVTGGYRIEATLQGPLEG